MSVTKVTGWFSKPGKGFPQVELKNFDGSPMVEKKDGKEVVVIGNEQFQSEQLTEESIDSTSIDSIALDMLESVGGDTEENRKRLAEMFRVGYNRVTRLEAGGLDPFQKAAKRILQLGLDGYKGKSVDEVADILRTLQNS